MYFISFWFRTQSSKCPNFSNNEHIAKMPRRHFLNCNRQLILPLYVHKYSWALYEMIPHLQFHGNLYLVLQKLSMLICNDSAVPEVYYLLSSVFIFLPFTYLKILDSLKSAIDPFQINSWNLKS